jgi:hypothetical protein
LIVGNLYCFVRFRRNSRLRSFFSAAQRDDPCLRRPMHRRHPTVGCSSTFKHGCRHGAAQPALPSGTLMGEMERGLRAEILKIRKVLRPVLGRRVPRRRGPPPPPPPPLRCGGGRGGRRLRATVAGRRALFARFARDRGCRPGGFGPAARRADVPQPGAALAAALRALAAPRGGGEEGGAERGGAGVGAGGRRVRSSRGRRRRRSGRRRRSRP